MVRSAREPVGGPGGRGVLLHLLRRRGAEWHRRRGACAESSRAGILSGTTARAIEEPGVCETRSSTPARGIGDVDDAGRRVGALELDLGSLRRHELQDTRLGLVAVGVRQADRVDQADVRGPSQGGQLDGVRTFDQPAPGNLQRRRPPILVPEGHGPRHVSVHPDFHGVAGVERDTLKGDLEGPVAGTLRIQLVQHEGLGDGRLRDDRPEEVRGVAVVDERREVDRPVLSLDRVGEARGRRRRSLGGRLAREAEASLLAVDEPVGAGRGVGGVEGASVELENEGRRLRVRVARHDHRLLDPVGVELQVPGRRRVEARGRELGGRDPVPAFPADGELDGRPGGDRALRRQGAGVSDGESLHVRGQLRFSEAGGDPGKRLP